MTEQLAGDELDPADPALKVAVGYYRLGTYEYNQRDVTGQWSAIVNDITDVTGDVFLGLGMGCARCHDHKFDPILQKDYYRLQAFFTPILPRNDLDLATPPEWQAYQVKLAAWEAKTAETARRSPPWSNRTATAPRQDAIDKFPAEMQAIIHKPQAERTPLEEQLAAARLTSGHPRVRPDVRQDEEEQGQGRLDRLAAKAGRARSLPADTPGAVLTATDVGPDAPRP